MKWANKAFLVTFICLFVTFGFFWAMHFTFAADASRRQPDAAHVMHYVEKARPVYVTPTEYAELSLLEYTLFGGLALLAVCAAMKPDIIYLAKNKQRRPTREERNWMLGAACIWIALLYIAGPHLAGFYAAHFQ